MAETLKAGRELDALIAETVTDDIAWDIVIEGTSRVGREFATRKEAGDYRAEIRDKWHVGPVVLHDCVPCYSTDIAAAWEVVEKLRERGWNVSIFAVTDGVAVRMDYAGSWETAKVSVDPREGGAPLAICLAALRAVGTSGGVPADSAPSHTEILT